MINSRKEIKDCNHLAALTKQFIGTEKYYKNSLFPRYRYTEGVKFVAETVGAYWLIDYIFPRYMTIVKKHKVENLYWHFKIDSSDENEGPMILIKVQDGDCRELENYEIGFTDFPNGDFEIWMHGGILHLPSEH